MIVTINDIPVFEAVLGKDGGMQRISLVDKPAVMSDFVAFDEQQRIQLYRVTDDEQRRVLGVVMRADFPIYRRDPDGYEYYIIYHADTIAEMAERYLMEGRQNEVNLDHDPARAVDGVNMVQYFIKGDGRNPEGFEGIADGSLFAEFHVTNDEVWDAIKDGTYKGFSLEGYFDLVPEQDEKGVRSIVDALKGRFSRIFKHEDMSKIQRFFAAVEAAIADCRFGSVSTSKGVLSWDGDEDLKAGDRVFIVDEDGNRTEAPDGDYPTDDGKTIVVADGAVAEIRDPEAEVASDNDVDGAAVEAAAQEAAAKDTPESFHRIVARLAAETYEDRYRAIYDALVASGLEYPYIEEASDDWCVVFDYENNTYHRYALTFSEDGTVTLGDSQEVKKMFVPMDFVSPFENGDAATEDVEAVRAENESLRAEIEALKAAPVAQNAHEEFRKTTALSSQKDAGLNRLARIVNAEK